MRGQVRQLELDLGSPTPAVGDRLGRVLWGWPGILVAWLPVALALAVFAQLGLLGLRPTLVERERLAGEQRRMNARLDGLSQRFRQLERQEEALGDEIFRARAARARSSLAFAPGARPLDLPLAPARGPRPSTRSGL